MRAECWSGSLKEREHLEDLGVDGRVILKLFIIGKIDGCWLYSPG